MCHSSTQGCTEIQELLHGRGSRRPAAQLRHVSSLSLNRSRYPRACCQARDSSNSHGLTDFVWPGDLLGAAWAIRSIARWSVAQSLEFVCASGFHQNSTNLLAPVRYLHAKP
ncbi:unnamed protein product [Symbiodinium natans]|uniref:Uncharacterized protein n=1 Tax=Symbiodinium natans TaxID=878477 RepID=A0A812K2P9_9DINO|nr:unnamed protein product [Symbiodinium natans]